MALDIYDAMSKPDHRYRLSVLASASCYQFIAGSNQQNTARAMLFGSRPPLRTMRFGTSPEGQVSRWLPRIATSRTKRRRSTLGKIGHPDDPRRLPKRSAWRRSLPWSPGILTTFPTVETLINDGFSGRCGFSRDHASAELKAACSNFIPLKSSSTDDPGSSGLKPPTYWSQFHLIFFRSPWFVACKTTASASLILSAPDAPRFLGLS